MLLVFATCGKRISRSPNSEGMIFYDVTYPSEQGNLMTELMPGEMVLKFKDDQMVSELKSIGGLMSITISADNRKKEMIQVLKDFDKRYGLMLNEETIVEWINRNPQLLIEELEGTELIAGYNCKKAIGRFNSDSLTDIQLFYTDQIDLESPNWFNPYSNITGVLLGYDIEYLGMRMRFRAREVKYTDIDDSVFEVKTPFENVEQDKMDDVCNQLATDFRN